MKRRLKSELLNAANASPIFTAIITALFAVILFSLPTVIKTGETAEFVLHIVCRALAVVLALFFAKICRFKLFDRIKISLSEIFILLLGLLVCVNNFPFIGLTTGEVLFTENADVLRYVFYCAAIGVSEEFVFRGLVMPLVGLKVRRNPRAPFLTVLISSAIFSLCHIFNIFSLGIVPTLAQIGYTFLTGGLFGIAYLITENLVIPVAFHIIFDIGGLAFSLPFGIAAGNMWDTLTIIITAALGIGATAVYLIKIFSYKRRED